MIHPRVGVRFLTDIPEKLLENTPFQTLLINVSSRDMLIGTDPELDEHAVLPRYGMMLANVEVPVVFGMTVKSKQDRSRMLFVATDDQDIDDTGALYARENKKWVKAIARERT